jgi:hypothetical protein
MVVTVFRETSVPDPQSHQSIPHSPTFLMMPPVKAQFFQMVYFLEIFRPKFFMYLIHFLVPLSGVKICLLTYLTTERLNILKYGVHLLEK